MKNEKLLARFVCTNLDRVVYIKQSNVKKVGLKIVDKGGK